MRLAGSLMDEEKDVQVPSLARLRDASTTAYEGGGPGATDSETACDREAHCIAGHSHATCKRPSLTLVHALAWVGR